MAVKKTSSGSPHPRGTKVDFMKTVSDIGTPIAALAGFAVGSYVVKKLQKNETVSGLLGADMKGYLIPGAVTLGGLVGLQFTDNKYIRTALIGAASAGIGATFQKVTGKTVLQGIEGIMGDEPSGETDLMALNPVTQALPAADIDIEREIQASVSGGGIGYNMGDQPLGDTETGYMEDDGQPGNSPEEGDSWPGQIGPDNMDYDIFSGDMMES